MIIKNLREIQKDINRLLVAGSKVAKGDTRLYKHIAFLEKAGERTPILKELGQRIELLFYSDQNNAVERMLDVSALLHAILYTQGSTSYNVNAKKVQTPIIALSEVSTYIEYDRIREIISNLKSNSMHDRYNYIMNAYHRGLLADSRLYPYIDKALGNTSSDLAYYIESIVIPNLGKKMIPYLVHSFEVDGSKTQLRRFRCLRALGYEHLESLVDDIFESEYTNLQLEAISSLGNNAKNTNRLINMLTETNDAKLQEIYKALVAINTKESLYVVVEIYLNNQSKKRLEILSDALSSSPYPFHFELVFEKIKTSLHKIKELAKQGQRSVDLGSFSYMLLAMKHSNQMLLLDFITDILSDINLYTIKYRKRPSLDIIDAIQTIISTYPIDVQLDFYQKSVSINIPDPYWLQKIWQNYFNTYTTEYNKAEYKEQIYNTFRDAYCLRYINFSDLVNLFYREKGKEFLKESDYINHQLIDPRWAKLLLMQSKEATEWDQDCNADIFHFLSSFAPSIELLDVLASQFLDKYTLMDDRQSQILICVVNIGKGGKKVAFDRLVESLEHKILLNQYFYPNHFWLTITNSIPRKYAEHFRELSDKYKDEPRGNIFHRLAKSIARKSRILTL